MNQIKTAWLFPDTLYLHGERGNILALQRFAKAAGIETETVKIDFETKDFSPLDYDIIFCPPGEITSFPAVIEYLKPLKGEFDTFIKEGRPLIVTGTSIAIWCKKIQREAGESFEGLGILDAVCAENDEVYGDDNYFECTYNGRKTEVIGSQIQMADFIGTKEEPFGKLIYGYGNTGKDRREGFKIENSIFTNTLGPFLVNNPWITQDIIKIAAGNKGIHAEEFSIGTELEEKSFEAKKKFIMNKTSPLTNCK